MLKDNETISYEQYYAANSDFTAPRVVNNEHEMVAYQSNGLHRIWMNDQNVGFAAHWHSAMEIIVPIENSYTVHCGETTFVIQPEQIFIIPSGVVHEIEAPSGGRRFVFIMNINSISKMRSFSRIAAILSQPILLSQEKDTGVYENIYNLLLQMRNDYFGGSEFSELSIQSLLLRLFVCLGENYNRQENVFSEATPAKRREYVEIFNGTLRYIDNHFTEDLSLADIAAKTGFSKFHFSRLFKQYTNYNFSDYLCFRRIREAETLLMRPDISITDVAISSGFLSISTFNRLFKQKKGCSPSEYRRNCTRKRDASPQS
ncbi:MAG: AraC family transcriptional regulator [Lachnospiraceae bacterium]|nr:AraC family transcriptional regulator [Lachnospiraceae bacterium]